MLIESAAIESDVIAVTTIASGRNESAPAEPVHELDPPVLSAVSEPPSGWLSIANEILAETLIELAADFEHEAKSGDERSVGLLLAAMVLRDRAAETVTAESTRWIDDLTTSRSTSDLLSTSSGLCDAS